MHHFICWPRSMTCDTEPCLLPKQWQQSVLATRGLKSWCAEPESLHCGFAERLGLRGRGHRQDGCRQSTVGSMCLPGPPRNPAVTYNLMVLFRSISSLTSHFRVHINMFLSTFCMSSTNDENLFPDYMDLNGPIIGG